MHQRSILPTAACDSLQIGSPRFLNRGLHLDIEVEWSRWVEIPFEAWLLKASPADIRKTCVCLPELRKLRTYDFVFSNDA